MEYLQPLLNKYNSGDATDAEKKQLLAILPVHEGALKHLMETGFKEALENEVQLLSQTSSQHIFDAIQRNKSVSPISGAVPSKIVYLTGKLTKWVAAAIVIGVLATTAWWYQSRLTGSMNKMTSIAEVSSRLATIENTSETVLTKILDDGSVVSLAPQSSVTFYKPWANNKRTIMLTGKAGFKVATDRLRPFTVSANGIITTVLGTEFSVDARDLNVQVKLFEGKVMVSSLLTSFAMKEMYLKPGQELSIDRQKGSYVVNEFDIHGKAGTGSNVSGTAGKKAMDNVQLSFNRTPLPEVFEKVSKRYNIKIKYNIRDIGKLSFTGVFLPNDPLPTIFTIICNPNDLAFKEDNGTVLISK